MVVGAKTPLGLKCCLYWYVLNFGFQFAINIGIEYGGMHHTYKTWKPAVLGFSVLNLLIMLYVFFVLFIHYPAFATISEYSFLLGLVIYEMFMGCVLGPLQFTEEEPMTIGETSIA